MSEARWDQGRPLSSPARLLRKVTQSCGTAPLQMRHCVDGSRRAGLFPTLLPLLCPGSRANELPKVPLKATAGMRAGHVPFGDGFWWLPRAHDGTRRSCAHEHQGKGVGSRGYGAVGPPSGTSSKGAVRGKIHPPSSWLGSYQDETTKNTTAVTSDLGPRWRAKAMVAGVEMEKTASVMASSLLRTRSSGGRWEHACCYM